MGIFKSIIVQYFLIISSNKSFGFSISFSFLFEAAVCMQYLLLEISHIFFQSYQFFSAQTKRSVSLSIFQSLWVLWVNIKTIAIFSMLWFSLLINNQSKILNFSWTNVFQKFELRLSNEYWILNHFPTKIKNSVNAANFFFASYQVPPLGIFLWVILIFIFIGSIFVKETLNKRFLNDRSMLFFCSIFFFLKLYVSSYLCRLVTMIEVQ